MIPAIGIKTGGKSMSMMKTLAKVAIGVAVAKGAKKMLQGGAGGTQQAGGGLGGLLGGLTGQQPQAQQSGGIEDLLRGALGGGQQTGGMGGQAGGLGGLLEGLTGAQGGAQGGLNDILGQLTQQGGGAGGLGGLLGQLTGGQAGGQTGGLGGLLGGLMGAAGGAAAGGAAQGGFGDLLNSAIRNQGEPEVAPSAEQEVAAGLMLRAMIQAAKSDGKIDAAEEQKLLGRLGDVSPEEQAFVQAELQKPVDVNALVAETPKGLEGQVYAMSVMGIDLDSQAEAQYLHQLAQGLGLDGNAVNDIHAQLGVPALYS